MTATHRPVTGAAPARSGVGEALGDEVGGDGDAGEHVHAEPRALVAAELGGPGHDALRGACLPQAPYAHRLLIRATIGFFARPPAGHRPSRSGRSDPPSHASMVGW